MEQLFQVNEGWSEYKINVLEVTEELLYTLVQEDQVKECMPSELALECLAQLLLHGSRGGSLVQWVDETLVHLAIRDLIDGEA